jgi:hypothetical protein
MHVRVAASVGFFVAAVSCFVLAWTFGNPPFASPDESAHYVRAVGVGQLDLLGDEAAFPEGYLPDPQLSWINQATREVDVPSGLSPVGADCSSAQVLVSAACQRDIDTPNNETAELTPVGTYQPLPYLLPGLAVTIANNPLTADYLGRLAAALPTIAVMALGIALAYRPRTRGLWLLGPLAAITPMVVFVSSTLSPSGLEIGAGFAFASAMVRIGTDEEAPRSAFLVAAIAGVVLSLSRSVAPLWLVLLTLVPIGLLGVRGSVNALKRAAPISWLSIGAVGLGLAINRVWDAAIGPDITISLSPLGTSLSDAFGRYSYVLQQEIGIFGYLEATMPRAGYLIWYGLLGSLMMIALIVAERRERLILIGTATAAVVTPALLFAAILRHTGFDLQGRHVLAFTVVVPLLAGAIVVRRRTRISGLLTSLPVWFALGAGTSHVIAWLANARRHAVGGEGRFFFLFDSEWAPPMGWAPWLLLLVGGAALLLVAAVSDGARLTRESPT